MARISRSLTAAICLAVLLDVPLPARHRPSVDTVLLAKVLAELGKIGSNINQIAYHLNAGRPGEVMEQHRRRPGRAAGMADGADASAWL